jgi:hypothetical protein
MKASNDEDYFTETFGDWAWTLFAAVGALTAFVFALVKTL